MGVPERPAKCSRCGKEKTTTTVNIKGELYWVCSRCAGVVVDSAEVDMFKVLRPKQKYNFWQE